MSKGMKELLKKVKDHKDNLISYEVIASHPIGEKVEISDGVTTERLENNIDQTMFFRVCMSKGSLLHSHYHECIEDLVLYQGEILEVLSNLTISDSKIMRFLPKQSHSLYAVRDSIFYSQLYKPKPKSK